MDFFKKPILSSGHLCLFESFFFVANRYTFFRLVPDLFPTPGERWWSTYILTCCQVIYSYIMLYHTARLVEEWNMKYISRGPKARVGYITHINRDEVEVDMSVYTTRIREDSDTQIAWRDWKLFEVIISKNISHKGRRPECDIFLDIITEDDFQPPWDILASKCSSIRVVYALILDKHN